MNIPFLSNFSNPALSKQNDYVNDFDKTDWTVHSMFPILTKLSKDPARLTRAQPPA
jgi:hypothetical protein